MSSYLRAHWFRSMLGLPPLKVRPKRGRKLERHSFLALETLEDRFSPAQLGSNPLLPVFASLASTSTPTSAPLGNADTSAISSINFLINGTTTVSRLPGKTHSGDTIQANFTVAAGSSNEQVSLVSYQQAGAKFSLDKQTVFNQDTGIFGPGQHTLTIKVPTTGLYQVDFVSGPVIEHFTGPTYHSQNRFLASDLGGQIGSATLSSTGTPTTTSTSTSTTSVSATTASLSGLVFEDFNNDGIRQATAGGGTAAEPVLAGVTLTLTGKDTQGGAVSLTNTTDVNGTFTLSNLPPSDSAGYIMAVTHPAGLLSGEQSPGTLVEQESTGSKDTVPLENPGTITSQGSFNVIIPQVSGGGTVTGINYIFAEVPAATLSGTVFADTNKDGVQQTGESGIAGQTVTLAGKIDGGTPFSQTGLTDSQGSFTLAGLEPSDSTGYMLSVTQPSGFSPGQVKAGTVVTSLVTNDPIVPASGSPGGANTVSGIVLVPGSKASGYTFGELQTSQPTTTPTPTPTTTPTPTSSTVASLSGVVFKDLNKDGVQQANAGETGLAGVTVTLTIVNFPGLPTSLTTTTDANGNYTLSNIPASSTASFSLSVTDPAGLLPGKRTVGNVTATIAGNPPVTIPFPGGTVGSAGSFVFLLPALPSPGTITGLGYTFAEIPGP